MKDAKMNSKNEKRPSKNKRTIAIFCAVLFLAIGASALTVLLLSNTDSSNIIETIDDLNYKVQLSDNLHIAAPGTYYLTGEITNGNVLIQTDGEVKLVLDNVSIKNSRGPAIFVQNAENVVISTTSGTENYLEDGKTYSGYEENEIGVVFSHDDLTLEGEGKLVIQSNNQSGSSIASKDKLTIESGTYEINSTGDAIYGKDSVVIKDGKFQITAAGKGIKSTNSDDDKGRGITISGGTFMMDCIDDAIHSNKDVNINKGTFTISSDDDAIHADGDLTIDDGKIDIQQSYEGLEGENIIINGGEISLVSSDDGINAAGGNDSSGSMERPGFGADRFRTTSNSSVKINGGKITINSTGDGLDSNGSIYVDGGEIMIYGPEDSANGALDYDGEFVMTSGVLLAGGSSGMAQGVSNNSTVYSVAIFFDASIGAKEKVSIVDSSKQEIISYQSDKKFNSLVVATSKLKKDQTYTIKIGGETYQEFTTSSIATQVGNNAGGFGGGMMGKGDMSLDMKKDMRNGAQNSTPPSEPGGRR